MALQPDYENYLVSSLLLWLNHRILDKGGFTNLSGQFYKMPQTVNGLTTYANPYGQLCSDNSVSNCSIPTGCFINGIYSIPGQNGLSGINYEKGQIYLTGNNTNVNITTNYSIKEFSVVLPVFPDQKLLFETKHSLRPKAGIPILSGINNDELNFPAIYIRSYGGNNKPYAFGGLKSTNTSIAIYLFCRSQYQLDLLNGLLKDCFQEYIPLISNSGLYPYNNLGGFKDNIPFNYSKLTTGYVGSGQAAFIQDVNITDFTKRGLFQEVKSLTNDSYFGVAEFELMTPRKT